MLILSTTLISCLDNDINLEKEGTVENITVSSTAFAHNGKIPAKYTCQGEDISPPITWSGIPQETKSIALIADDPDAPMGTWVHWVIYLIPPEKFGLKENVPKAGILESGMRQGLNSSRGTGYQGPCPPSGEHRYFFKVYALDFIPELDAEISKQTLLNEMEGHILGYGEIIGLYEKK